MIGLTNGGSAANNLHMVSAVIPRGRMKGDVDGDGRFTYVDYVRAMGIATKTYTTYTTDEFNASDINNDGSVTTGDALTVQRIVMNLVKPGYCAEMTGTWTSNPNFESSSAQFYIDISIEGITTNSDVLISISEDNADIYDSFEIINNNIIRVWVKLCPVTDIPCLIIWSDKGSGTLSITNKFDNQMSERLQSQIMPISYYIYLDSEEWSTRGTTSSQSITIPEAPGADDYSYNIEITFDTDQMKNLYTTAGISYTLPTARGSNTTFKCSSENTPKEDIYLKFTITPVNYKGIIGA